MSEAKSGTPLWQLQENLRSKLSIQKTLDDDLKKLNQKISTLNEEIAEYQSAISKLEAQ